MIVGFACALVAALAYGLATPLQAVAVRGGRSWLYVVGLALDGVGYLVALVALHRLPLFAVQSLVAASVGVTAVAAVIWLDARLHRADLVALAVIGIGLLGLAVSATESPPRQLPALAAWALLLSALPLGAIALALVRRRTRLAAAVLAVVAGLGFGGAGIGGRVLVLEHPLWHLLGSPVLWSLAAYGLISLVAFALALQRGSTTTVSAITFVVETVVPAAIGVIWLGDEVRSGWTWAAGAGVLLTLAGCVALARFGSVEESGTKTSIS